MKKIIAGLALLIALPVFGQESSIGIYKYHSTDDVGDMSTQAMPSIGAGLSFQYLYENNTFLSADLKLISADYVKNIAQTIVHVNAYRVPINIGKRFGNDLIFSELSIGPNISIYSNYIYDNIGETNSINVDGYSTFLGINYSAAFGMSIYENYELSLGVHSSSDLLYLDFISSTKFLDLNHRSVFFGLKRKL